MLLDFFSNAEFAQPWLGSLPGDYNKNGAVDTADYVVWRKNGGTQAEYETWRTHFDQMPGSGSGSLVGTSSQFAVPEPAGALLLVIGIAVGTRRKRRIELRIPSTH